MKHFIINDYVSINVTIFVPFRLSFAYYTTTNKCPEQNTRLDLNVPFKVHPVAGPHP